MITNRNKKSTSEGGREVIPIALYEPLIKLHDERYFLSVADVYQGGVKKGDSCTIFRQGIFINWNCSGQTSQLQ